MGTMLSLIGLVASFFLIKKRERVGEMIGYADWMQHFGGIYNIIILTAIFIFFWSIAYLTDTMHIFFYPVRWLIPGFGENSAPSGY